MMEGKARKENMTGGTPSFRCERLSTRPARRNAHASFFCVVFAFLFSDVSISMGPQDGWSGIGDWGPRREYQIMDLAWGLGGTRLRHLSQDEARISTPTVVWTKTRHSRCLDLRQWEASLFINIGTFGMPAQRELSSRHYPSAPVAVLKTYWSSICKTEHQIVRNPPSTKRRSNITATR